MHIFLPQLQNITSAGIQYSSRLHDQIFCTYDTEGVYAPWLLQGVKKFTSSILKFFDGESPPILVRSHESLTKMGVTLHQRTKVCTKWISLLHPYASVDVHQPLSYFISIHFMFYPRDNLSWYHAFWMNEWLPAKSQFNYDLWQSLTGLASA